MLRKDNWKYLNALLQLDLSLIECLMTIHSIAYFYAKFVYVSSGISFMIKMSLPS